MLVVLPKAWSLIPVVSRSTALTRFLKSVLQKGALNLAAPPRVSELFLKVSIENSLDSLISALLLGSCSSEKPITCSQSSLALDSVLVVLRESSANNSSDQVLKSRSLLSRLRHLQQQLPLHVCTAVCIWRFHLFTTFCSTPACSCNSNRFQHDSNCLLSC